MKKVIPIDAKLIPQDAKKVFDGVIFDVFQWQQQMFDGTTETFEMLRRPDTVQVICIDEGKVLVLEEEQPHIGRRVNFTGGRVDSSDASIELAAHREVKEETGLSFKELKLISVEQPQVKIEWFIYTFIATEVSGREKPELDAGERITMKWLNSADLLTALTSGELLPFGTKKFLSRLTSIEDLLAIPKFEGLQAER